MAVLLGGPLGLCCREPDSGLVFLLTSQTWAVAPVLSLSPSLLLNGPSEWILALVCCLLYCWCPPIIAPGSACYHHVLWDSIFSWRSTACADLPLALGSFSVVGQSHSFCSLENVGKGNTASMFLSGVPGTRCMHWTWLKEVGRRRASSGWGMKHWVAQPYRYGDSPVTCVGKDVSWFEEVLNWFHTWWAYLEVTLDMFFSVKTSPKCCWGSVSPPNGLTAVVIMQCSVYFSPCFCHDTIHSTRAPISVFGDVIFLHFCYYHFLNCSLGVATNSRNQCFVSDYHPSTQPICRQPAQICPAK